MHKGEQVTAGGPGCIAAQRAADVAQHARHVSREQHLYNRALPDIYPPHFITLTLLFLLVFPSENPPTPGHAVSDIYPRHLIVRHVPLLFDQLLRNPTRQLGERGTHQAGTRGMSWIIMCHAAGTCWHHCAGKSDFATHSKGTGLTTRTFRQQMKEQNTVIAGALKNAWSQSPAHMLSCSSSLSGTTSACSALQSQTVSHVCMGCDSLVAWNVSHCLFTRPLSHC